MHNETLFRLRRLAVGLLAIGIVVLLGSARWGAGPSHAQTSGTASMSFTVDDCSDDCDFVSGATFTLRLLASQLPSEGYGGFQSETFLGGLTYNQRGCEDELKMDPLALCLGPTIGTARQVSHGGLTALPVERPIPGSTSEVMVEMSVTCSSDGAHELWVTAAPDSPLGSKFKDVNGDDILLNTVGTRTVDLNNGGAPLAIDMADILTVNCGAANGRPSSATVPPPYSSPEPTQAAATASARATLAAGGNAPTAEGTAASSGTPSGTVTPPPGRTGTATPNGDGSDDGGVSGGVWAIIIVAIVAGVAGAGGAGWWYWRRRTGASPGA